MSTDRRLFTMDEIMELFRDAVEEFNDCLNYDFSVDQFVIQGIVMDKNREHTFEEFCSKYFPYRLNDDYKKDEYYQFIASAFPGKKAGDKQGVLFRLDVECDENELYHIMLHELAHIYCTHNELDGKIFYDEYCEDYAKDRELDGQINAGYSVWREFIAELIAIECDETYDRCYLFQKEDLINFYISNINRYDGKLAVSKILEEVMLSVEVLNAENWQQAENAIKESKLFEQSIYMEMFKLVYVQLKESYISINIEFIKELGFIYLMILSFSEINRMKEFM